ncbi:hypothetical protein L486_07469 [Kwoniella mangroviensis CBS 10435]|uniref:Uncharacterized protein n=1 Tax=Kwoniella mangroviensis CBS 10435 TaxID=1331196 RepID=A0A1B9IHF8_9TREE|nr:uncharacterized protein I203_03291 [Kwoniella mangroviensis CBS 8507]OCF54814.1 hypothetical protein L486_07469 [Kwoniella mangroviensis CBS 10435]OCF67594.1 hypothetical protein I203_03291 [Kwoniella mangroviensis CBS 8507]OCF72841.1 hypothetical protein I204_06070 [Kwoniella mangroviensis CBS 8886]
MGCFSSKHIDPRMISEPVPIPSQSHQPYPSTNQQQYPEQHAYPPSAARYDQDTPPQLRPYQFPTRSFEPRGLPPGHPFANPYSKYMP